MSAAPMPPDALAADALTELRDAMRRFAAERDWDRFHTPKNLAMALSGEAGELIGHFPWLTAEEFDSLPAPVLEQVALALVVVSLLLFHLRVDIAHAHTV